MIPTQNAIRYRRYEMYKLAIPLSGPQSNFLSPNAIDMMQYEVDSPLNLQLDGESFHDTMK